MYIYVISNTTSYSLTLKSQRHLIEMLNNIIVLECKGRGFTVGTGF